MSPIGNIQKELSLAFTTSRTPPTVLPERLLTNEKASVPMVMVDKKDQQLFPRMGSLKSQDPNGAVIKPPDA